MTAGNPSIFALAPLLLALLATSADAGCRKAGLSEDGKEGLCLTTPDGGPGRDNQYIDDRRAQRRHQYMRELADERRASDQRMEKRRQFYQARQDRREGASHTWDMASGGTRTSSGIVVSPFPAGSNADRAWQSERKRRGLCGNDRLCNMAD